MWWIRLLVFLERFLRSSTPKAHAHDQDVHFNFVNQAPKENKSADQRSFEGLPLFSII